MSEPPKSPCILVCQLDRRTGWCLGCGRTGDEIMEWPRADAARQREILAPLADRLRALGLPPGGDADQAEARAAVQRRSGRR